MIFKPIRIEVSAERVECLMNVVVESPTAVRTAATKRARTVQRKIKYTT